MQLDGVLPSALQQGGGGQYLIWRLGEHCLFPEVRGEVTVGLENGIKSGLGEVARVAVQPLAEV